MRRSLLLSAATLLAIGGFAAQAGAAPARMLAPPSAHAAKWRAASPKNNSIVGTWQASYNGGVHNAYVQWQKGGTAMQLTDLPPKTGNNVIVGDWKDNGDGTDSAFLVAWVYDDKGINLINTFTKSETVTVSGNSYSGTFEVTFYDLDGNIVFQQDGTVTATRIQ